MIATADTLMCLIIGHSPGFLWEYFVKKMRALFYFPKIRKILHSQAHLLSRVWIKGYIQIPSHRVYALGPSGFQQWIPHCWMTAPMWLLKFAFMRKKMMKRRRKTSFCSDFILYKVDYLKSKPTISSGIFISPDGFFHKGQGQSFTYEPFPNINPKQNTDITKSELTSSVYTTCGHM